MRTYFDGQEPVNFPHLDGPPNLDRELAGLPPELAHRILEHLRSATGAGFDSWESLRSAVMTIENATANAGEADHQFQHSTNGIDHCARGVIAKAIALSTVLNHRHIIRTMASLETVALGLDTLVGITDRFRHRRIEGDDLRNAMNALLKELRCHQPPSAEPAEPNETEAVKKRHRVEIYAVRSTLSDDLGAPREGGLVKALVTAVDGTRSTKRMSIGLYRILRDLARTRRAELPRDEKSAAALRRAEVWLDGIGVSSARGMDGKVRYIAIDEFMAMGVTDSAEDREAELKRLDRGSDWREAMGQM